LKDRREVKEETPSLLERQSSGGDVAEGGFSFQECVIISYVPAWLAHEGFEEMTRESMGDAEARFFAPGRPQARELVEVKNHALTNSEFWAEIDRFRMLDRGSPETYSWFTLVVKGLSADQRRLARGLRRVRDPYSFYEGTAVAESSFAEYAKIARRMGRTDDDALFLFERVLIREDLTTDESQWKAVLHDELAKYFPEYGDLSLTTVRSIHDGIGDLLRSRRNKSISRKDVEQRIRSRVPESIRPPLRPTVLRTLMGGEETETGTEIRPIRLDWQEFFGGAGRSYPSPARWDEGLVGDLRQAKDWILRNRSSRRIRLTGNRRLSASLAIGAVFSAVAGFSIEMEGRDGEPWTTDAHYTADTLDFPTRIEGDLFPADRLIVSVGVRREIGADVEEARVPLGLAGMPTLHLFSDEAVRSPEHANKAVKVLKDEVVNALSETGADSIDLFFAGPATLALIFGHRINAMATVRCYEWVSRGRYVPTCEIPQ
jgi:hypothetical protein